MQTLLNLKDKIEKRKELEYGQALAKLEEERRIKRELEGSKKKNIDDFRGGLNEAIKPLDIRSYNQFIDYLKKKIKAQEAVIKKAEAFAETKRLELVEAMKERKTLEALKEKDFEEYKVEEARAEQRIIDEIVSFRFNQD